jgi:hypothetical protein
MKILYDNKSGCITTCLKTKGHSNIVHLDHMSVVNVISHNGNKYVLNGGETYNIDARYSLTTGEYKLTNIPSNHPLAITDTNDMISYTGDADKKMDMNNISYYHGDITIKVMGNFNTASIKCYYHGYMGGQNVLVYSS